MLLHYHICNFALVNKKNKIMKKLITVKEMGAIVNAFKLSEDEQWFMHILIDSINREKNECMSLHYGYIIGWSFGGK